MKELFFNHPTKQWHFEELRIASGLSRAQTNEWLKKLKKEQLIKRVKPKGKMPYHVANWQHPHYKNTKRLFGLTALHECGLLDYISSLEGAETVVIFGSFSRWDWYDNSDVDIFIYGDVKEIFVGKFGSKLKREVQIFHGKNIADLKKMGKPLLKNVIKGITLNGTLPQEVLEYAAV